MGAYSIRLENTTAGSTSRSSETRLSGLRLTCRSRSARNTIDLSGCFVTAGFIDINAHVDARGAWRSVNPDHHSLRNGVTTVVDSGSTGWKTFESFKRTVIDRARTRVLAFLNIAAGGISSDGRATQSKTSTWSRPQAWRKNTLI